MKKKNEEYQQNVAEARRQQARPSWCGGIAFRIGVEGLGLFCT